MVRTIVVYIKAIIIIRIRIIEIVIGKVRIIVVVIRSPKITKSQEAPNDDGLRHVTDGGWKPSSIKNIFNMSNLSSGRM